MNWSCSPYHLHTIMKSLRRIWQQAGQRSDKQKLATQWHSSQFIRSEGCSEVWRWLAKAASLPIMKHIRKTPQSSSQDTFVSSFLVSLSLKSYLIVVNQWTLYVSNRYIYIFFINLMDMKVLNGTLTLSEMKWSSRSRGLWWCKCTVSQSKINESGRRSTLLWCQMRTQGKKNIILQYSISKLLYTPDYFP